MGQLNTFKEKHVIELKSYKERLDQMIKGLDFQLGSCEENLRVFCSKTLSDFENNIKNLINNLNLRISEVKMENNKYSHDLLKRAGLLKEEHEKILKIKNELIKTVAENSYNNKEINKKTNDNFNMIKLEFEEMQGKFIDLSEFIKVSNYMQFQVLYSFI